MQNCKIVLYDPQWKGHHVEFVAHIVRYWKSEYGIMLIVCHPKMANALRELRVADSFSIRYSVFNDDEVQALEELEGQYFARGKLEWSLLSKYTNGWVAERIFFMSVNTLQWEISRTSLPAQAARYSGILFNPVSMEYTKWGIVSISRNARKLLQYAILLLRRSCFKLYILNDQESVRRLNRVYFWRKEVFQYLPDPVNASFIKPALNMAEKRDQMPECCFLLFGSLGPRKGIKFVLDAIRYLPDYSRARIHIKIAGKFISDEYFTEMSKYVGLVQSRFPDVRISVDNRHYTFEEMDTEMRNATALLAPYSISNASSGILGQAAYYRKTIIGISGQLIGKIINKYKLGVTIQEGDLHGLAAAMADIQTHGQRLDGLLAEQYCEERSPGKFASTIILDTIG